jgi:alkylation response protein AidB-like acyl-CoA dehydrogenase
MSRNLPTHDLLVQRFHPIFARIAEHAVQREHARELAHEAIGWLREARFGALRVPIEHGGFGATPEQLYELLIDLAEADSNLPQALRAHFGFVERVLAEFEPNQRAHWLRRVADGAIFGNATTEQGDSALGRLQTRLFRENGAWLLTGAKYYSTGTLYADWVAVTAEREGGDPTQWRTIALVRTDAPGVECVDDWRGFGQRLTASGTTRFERVPVAADDIIDFSRSGTTLMTAVFQLFHIATLAGIARAIERDAVAFVQPRKRVFSHASGDVPRDDPLVQQVIGHLASTAFIATLATREVARGLGELDRWRVRGEPLPEDLLVDVELRAAKAQVAVTEAVLAAATRLFDVGGASALQEDRRLDRHWRNARTLASHNPVIYKSRVIGEHALNGTRPTFYWAVGTREAQAAS